MSAASPAATFTHRRRRGAELLLLLLASSSASAPTPPSGSGSRRRCRSTSSATACWLAALAVGCHICGAPHRAVRRPGAAPRRVRAQRPRPGGDPPHRPARRTTSLSAKQLMWMTLGRAAVRRRAGPAARPPPAAGVHLHVGASPRSCCCCCRCSPGIGTEINGARIWIGVGNFSFQPGEIAKVALVIAFAGYLVLHRDALALAGRRVAGDRPPPRPRPRPDPGRCGWSAWGCWSSSATSAPACCSSGCSWSCCTSPPSVPAGSSSGPPSSSAGSLLGLLALRATCRPASRGGWTRSHHDAPRPDRRGPLRDGLGRAGRARARAGRALADPVLLLRLHRRRGRARSSGSPAMMAMIVLFGLIVERALRTALICRDGFGKLMATGLRRRRSRSRSSWSSAASPS